jgi:hypothetical protein
MNMGKRIFQCSMLLFVVIFSIGSFAEEIKYPPYPDVWGHEFPRFGNNLSGPATMGIRQEKNGDYLITFEKRSSKETRTDGSCCFYKRVYSNYHFFADIEQEFSNHEEYLQFERINRENIVKDQGSMVFKNGIRMVRESEVDFLKFPRIKKIKNNKDIDSYILVYVLDYPIKEGVNKYAEINDNYNKNEIITYVLGVYPSFIPLKDETFLIKFGGDVIIRFDVNLKSKSPILGKRVFVLNPKVLYDISRNLGKELNNQTLVNSVYEHILHMREKEK